jgi:hypothetical protein
MTSTPTRSGTAVDLGVYSLVLHLGVRVQAARALNVICGTSTRTPSTAMAFKVAGSRSAC